MNRTSKLNLQFVDRIGIVADISRHVARLSVNIVSMEVQRKQELADVYLEVDPSRREISARDVLETLSSLDGLQSIRLIETMPHENRQNTFRTVLDNVSDGIVSIDAGGNITTINRLARTIYNCLECNPIGKRIDQTPVMDDTLLSCLEGKTVSRLRHSVATDKGRFQFFISARPIVDASGRITGAVKIMKDMREIEALVEKAAQAERISFETIVGDSPTVNEAIAFARKIAPTAAIVSIRGQSGTGKELFARAIHFESGRSGPFVAVNCAAIPDALLESELFGYESGSFTGASKSGHTGLFEQAKGGTLFLDEIADLPPGPQAKILRAIQEKRIRRIGGRSEIEIDARIVTATNRHLEQLVADGAFRQDLYYRINVLPVHLPPLQARREDIPVLADHFLFQINCRLGTRLQRLTRKAQDKLARHDWPGNVRELKNVIERAAILCDAADIGAESILFSFELSGHAPDERRPAVKAHGNAPLSRQLDALERRIVIDALNSSKSIRQAASGLGISHTALRNKIKKHGLQASPTGYAVKANP
ncbi:Fis family transcriptional regulator [Desulfosarcina widdelii]|uniref:HTH-type transcriptional regulatory protein TyrR n=1 Tax=Desulfosarcina widdelii TaxID=947919 RepID=A0A5K7ZAA2_9BACT|nr:sigma 54-interacting transcriptional regulator [Desulfosarcina widdelii]BBO73397.1 Fis family transcriptional regulator [Desulfosarcina widdelii]